MRLGGTEREVQQRARAVGGCSTARETSPSHARSGRLIAASEPRYGYSHETDWVVLLFFGWTTSDVVPEEDAE